MKEILFESTYTREDGLAVIDIEDIPLPKDFEKKYQGIVIVPPGAKGGNHAHPRTEVFVAIGPLLLIWQDDTGSIKRKKMWEPGSKLRLFIIPPNLPHAIVNTSNQEYATIYEFADAKQHEVKPTELV